MPKWSPSLVILCALAAGLLLGGLSVVAAVGQPWLGLRLVATAETETALEPRLAVTGVAAEGPAAAAGVTAGMHLQAIADGQGRQLTLRAEDLLEEPDFLPTYEAIVDLLARQDLAAGILAHDWVQLSLIDPEGEPQTVWLAPAPMRPIGQLPALFWVQIVTGVGAMLIGGWVLALRQDDRGAMMFALSAPTLAVSAFCSAIYGTRELALDGSLFRVLAALNHWGALGFGVAMIALFLVYPRRLVPDIVPGILAVAMTALWVLDTARLLPAPAMGIHLPVMIEMIVILALIGVQWRLNRRDPRARAGLRWLGLSVALGAGVFVSAMAVPLVFGGEQLMSQGLAFGFFLLIYIGIALGVRRYRLFELDEWAFRVMFYTLGAMLLLVLDGALILVIGLDQGPSLGLSLIAVGFGYLPLRDLLWRRMVLRRRMPDHELFRRVIEVAFTATPVERAARWRDLIRSLFDPLTLAPSQTAVAVAVARDDGVLLLLPAAADAPALAIGYPWRGRGLFGPAHLQLARELTQLMAHADEGRAAYERGASEERHRIARDLHDDVGARLLTGLHKPDLPQTRQVIRSAMADIRTIAAGLARGAMPLGRVIADLRHETGGRLEAAGLTLDWPLDDGADDEVMLDYPVYRNLFGALREIISNVIRHAQATSVRVEIGMSDGWLRLVVCDDGIGLDIAASEAGASEAGAAGSGGLGLGNLARRVTELGGVLRFPETSRGTQVALDLPLCHPARRTLGVSDTTRNRT